MSDLLRKRAAAPPFDLLHYIHHEPAEDEPDTIGGYFSVVLFDRGEGVWSGMVDEGDLDAAVGPELAARMRRGEGEDVSRQDVVGEETPFKELTPPGREPEFGEEDKRLLHSMGIVGRQRFSKKRLGADAEVLPKSAGKWSLIIGDEHGKQELARFYVDSQDEGVQRLKGMANVPLRPDQERELREKGVIWFGSRLVRLRDEDYPQRRLNVYAARPPRFSFTVPMKAAGGLAFHLAKAGMTDFEVEHYREDESSMFTFPSEPEMHVAEEIVKAEYADQIRARKGLWGMWADGGRDLFAEPGQEKNPAKYVASVVRKAAAWEARLRGKVAGQWGDRSQDGDAVHDILDKHRQIPTSGNTKGFDEPVPAEQLPLVLKELDGMSGGDDPDHYLGVVTFLVTHGSDVPNVYRQRALQIAFALAQDEAYLGKWRDPDLRRAALENEIELLEGRSKTADILPEPPREPYDPMADPELYDPETGRAGADSRMVRDRRKRMVSWIEEMGLDFSEELRKFDEGDFAEKDSIYEEMKEIIREDRRERNSFRR